MKTFQYLLFVLTLYFCFYLAGAICHRCPVTMEEAHNIDVVKNGFEDHWNIEKLHQHYDSLKKNPDGTIKVTHKGIKILIHISGTNFKEH